MVLALANLSSCDKYGQEYVVSAFVQLRKWLEVVELQRRIEVWAGKCIPDNNSTTRLASQGGGQVHHDTQPLNTYNPHH
jgi:hypothetical protein